MHLKRSYGNETEGRTFDILLIECCAPAAGSTDEDIESFMINWMKR